MNVTDQPGFVAPQPTAFRDVNGDAFTIEFDVDALTAFIFQD